MGHKRQEPVQLRGVPVFFTTIVVCFYIGYFGAGAGFLTITMLSLFGIEDLNEINALIWPSPDNIGAMPQETWDKTVQIMLDAGLITEPPSEGAWRGDLTEAAWALLADEDIDLKGEGFQKGTVEVTPKGE